MVLMNKKSTAESDLAPNTEFAPVFLAMNPSTRSVPIENKNNPYMAKVIS